jgi:hypothetical protein
MPQLAANQASIDPLKLHPSASALLAYWKKIHPPAGLPGRQHFDPASVPALLPNVLLVDVHRDPLRFRYRLLGTRVDAVYGTSLVGRWLEDIYIDPQARIVLDEYRIVAEQQKPVWRSGRPAMVPEPRCALIEILRLPLASDSQKVDMVLGLTLYFDGDGMPVETPSYRRLGYGSQQTGCERTSTATNPSSERPR